MGSAGAKQHPNGFRTSAPRFHSNERGRQRKREAGGWMLARGGRNLIGVEGPAASKRLLLQPVPLHAQQVGPGAFEMSRHEQKFE
eukprot:3934197-Rhodomonas_salina.2